MQLGRRSFAFTLFLLLVNPAIAQIQPPSSISSPSPIASEAGVVNEAAVVLQELTKGTVDRIPERLLSEAYALAIIPHAMRGAFIIGLGGGRGILLTRDSRGQFQGPEFITFAGGSVGWQVGIQSNDLLIVFRTPRSLDSIRQGRLTLGANASVAAGPIGRYAGAATDSSLQAEILTYSRSRGLFAGVSLQGSSIQLDPSATQRFYQLSPSNQNPVVPPIVYALVNELNHFAYSGAVQAKPGTTAGDRAPSDPEIQKLATDVAALQARVDSQWKEYLALPNQWLSTNRVTSTDLQGILVRYERIETNPQFDKLRNLQEFKQVLEDLRKLAGPPQASSDELILPPPPAPSR